MKEKWFKTITGMVQGKCKKNPKNPKEEAVYHPKLGRLHWTLEDGTVVVCRTYYEFKQKHIKGD